MILEGFDHDEFLATYWQRQPLLIKHTGEPFADPIEPDDLAGLACEETVESRIVAKCSDRRWQISHGPFDVADFAGLGEKDWTLLVQAVDQLDPDVALLKGHFDFLPGWRIDDVMVSYASTDGGVGPHYDQYDVFLIQGMGKRRWKIGGRCDSTSPLQEGTELRLLQEFTTVQEVVLEPGDILYLPPRYAHHGISLGESLCYSIGFRAPSFADLLQGFSDELADSLNEDRRFED
ncbi:MAG: cupin domain-containing protein, partial [Gammaproteobacteria bacterium]|nr:cupin domain-containing protein [Gammaproteobacteria bacterium]